MPELNKKINFDPLNTINLFGLKKYLFDFIGLFKVNKLPKVILLSGKKGIGKFTLSFHLINYIFSQNSDHKYDYDKQIINKDNLFYKSIISNVSENFFFISNEINKKTSIEDIRNIKKKFSTSSLNNIPRFTILDDVELLNINAANSLLKLIEEPTNQNYFVLINNERKNVIETIKSRALETKIFLNKESKRDVFNELIKYFNIQDHFSHEFIDFTTPGQLIKYSFFLEKLPIDIETSLYDTVLILLENYKKTKNDIFLDCIDFFLEIKFSREMHYKSYQFVHLIRKKNEIMRLLYNHKNFNLSSSSVLEYIRRHEQHV